MLLFFGENPSHATTDFSKAMTKPREPKILRRTKLISVTEKKSTLSWKEELIG
jgi:hypothetical protein